MNLQYITAEYTGKTWDENNVIYSNTQESLNVLMQFKDKEEAEKVFNNEKIHIPLALRIKQGLCKHNQDIVMNGYREGQYFKFCSKCHIGKYVDERTPEQIQEQKEKSLALFKQYKKTEELEIIKSEYETLERRLSNYNNEFGTNLTINDLSKGCF